MWGLILDNIGIVKEGGLFRDMNIRDLLEGESCPSFLILVVV